MENKWNAPINSKMAGNHLGGNLYLPANMQKSPPNSNLIDCKYEVLRSYQTN